MKIAVVTLLILGTMLMSTQACYRYCRIRKLYFYPQCCPSRLHYVYVRSCSYRNCGKRSLEQSMDIGFPCNFDEYDTDKNGKISREEFKAKVGGNFAGGEDLDSLFDDVNKNKDDGIDCLELEKSRLEFKCKPSKCKDTTNDESQDEFWNTNN